MCPPPPSPALCLSRNPSNPAVSETPVMEAAARSVHLSGRRRRHDPRLASYMSPAGFKSHVFPLPNTRRWGNFLQVLRHLWARSEPTIRGRYIAYTRRSTRKYIQCYYTITLDKSLFACIKHTLVDIVGGAARISANHHIVNTSWAFLVASGWCIMSSPCLCVWRKCNQPTCGRESIYVASHDLI